MMKRASATQFFFDRLVLQYPRVVLLCFLLISVFLGFQARHFRLDASAETLVLENDQDLEYSRLISSRYGERDFLIMTYSPKTDLLCDSTLKTLKDLTNEILTIPRVASVHTILDVPLLQSPAVALSELTNDLPTLNSPGVNKDLARAELTDSVLYQDLLVSPDLKTTSLLISFYEDDEYYDLLHRRNELRSAKASGILTQSQRQEYKQIQENFRQHRDEMRHQRHEDIKLIRSIMNRYRQNGGLFLGGTSMIADDMIGFIKSDFKLFGLGVLFLLILTLGLIFGRLRWICLPLTCCAISVIWMMGLLGWFGWEVTIVSSNFISLQIIMTMAITIHLITRYRELASERKNWANRRIILQTIVLKIKPCVYAVLTTIAGFGSLIFCDMLPVIMFGWMMIAGLIISLVVTFVIFPTVLILLPKLPPPKIHTLNFPLTIKLGKFTQKHGVFIIAISCLILIASLVEISKLKVENSFIDYFKKDTEIYRGMKVIDLSLGGTTPLDIVIDFESSEDNQNPSDAVDKKNEAWASDGNDLTVDAGTVDFENDNDVFDEFDDFDLASTNEKYWFTSDKINRIKAAQRYLESLPQTGKILSLANIINTAEKLNNGKKLDSFDLALLYNETPEEFRNTLIKPYVSVEHNQARFWVRIRDSKKHLRRDELLRKIKTDLPALLGIKAENVHLAGLLVLYNNMLQSLFNSLVLTFGITLLILTGMFFVLFRSLKIAIVAMIPNILPIAFVLGLMGFLDIPLDMMTITIAAIGVGIAVDDTIHYIHRFKYEFSQTKDYIATMHKCHGSIGYAMYYTSITIITGFSILGLSNFIPTVYFGLLTSLAMLMALLAALTLLPQLLILTRPFGKVS